MAATLPAPTDIRVEDLSSLCSLGMAPELLTGYLVQVLVGHFAAADQIANPLLRGYVWRDAEDTPINIQSANRWNPRQGEKRPGLIVRALDQDRADQHSVIGDRVQSVAPSQGEEFINFWLGQHAVFCCAGESGEADQLTTEVWMYLNGIVNKVQAMLGLMRLRVTGRKAARPMTEHAGRYAGVVDLAYGYAAYWRLEADLPPIRKFRLSTTI